MMKSTKIFIQMIVAGALLLGGCKAKFIGLDPSVEIYKVPGVTAKVDGNAAITLSDLNSFSGKVLVDLYFKDQPGPDKVDIVVRKNLQGGGNVKVLQEGVTSFPSTITVTAAQLQSLFGELKVGDTYDVAPNIYTSDGKFEAFPANGPGTATSVTGAPGYSAFARFTVR
ncbi:hypothetical protein [Leadbetterella byssophila]|jgi:hypothetical protein|uniref:Lipoprotein n=1 Tax=Leadbetterella byssophila (strain DSM 17132 / JCM 16389 / KACC 11308 / NBRC 106382 / 4M15) TaxID=649349 RepID=E4RR90_LEAB4|nr:hypothetical protein [Leadbetterella byssophila]ADQ17576.1 hypothetical protein Lbys_1874 [Leadbetterella byssophila DSM 17132]